MDIESQSFQEGEFRPRWYSISDDESGLRAFVVVDDTSLGPAAGGIRTRAYADEGEALDEARALARSMTYKCALAGLGAGGGKGVVIDRPKLDRRLAFARLGAFVDSLGGEFLTAGDFGTRGDDLAAMAGETSHVYTDELGLADAVGRGCVRAMEACSEVLAGAKETSPNAAAGPPSTLAPGSGRGEAGLADLRVAVQGCGSVGAAVAGAARRAGATVLVADLDTEIASRVAADLDVAIVSPQEVLRADVDIVAPCAIGGVLTAAVANQLSAAAVCGAANNILAVPEVEDRLMQRAILYVPGPLSSAGAVIEGVGRVIMGLDDCGALIDRVRRTTRRVLCKAAAQRRRAGDVARELALARIRAARA